jgi:hypothetical protein
MLTGADAIEHAERFGGQLHKHADPTEGARENISVDEARDVVRGDPSLIYTDSPAPVIYYTDGDAYVGADALDALWWDLAQGDLVAAISPALRQQALDYLQQCKTDEAPMGVTPQSAIAMVEDTPTGEQEDHDA